MTSLNRPSDACVRGFTLVELICVVGIMVILISLMVPAVQSLTGGAGRQGAINQLLGIMDQARVAALQSGAPTYVGFADKDFPVPEMRYRSYIVFRDRLDSDEPAAGTANASTYVYLSKWRTLPTGVSFYTRISPSLVQGTSSVITVGATDGFPRAKEGTPIPVLKFNSNGSVSQPSSPAAMKLYIYEGFYDAGGDVVTGSRGELLDVITLARFTGRPRLEVSSQPSLRL